MNQMSEQELPNLRGVGPRQLLCLEFLESSDHRGMNLQKKKKKTMHQWWCTAASSMLKLE